jgi:hypothetical protein
LRLLLRVLGLSPTEQFAQVVRAIDHLPISGRHIWSCFWQAMV